MTYKERLDREKGNLTKIVLYNDRGLFFNLVERSAYAFHTRIKPFKVNIKTVKGLDKPFVSIGVPVKHADGYLQGMTIEKDEQGNLTAHLPEPIVEQAFLAWKEHVISQNKQTTPDAEEDATLFPTVVCERQPNEYTEDEKIIKECVRELKQLNIASMTPMEAMFYLNSLQQKLKAVNI